jgi:hypothetical protein
MLTAVSATDQAIYSLLILIGLIVCFWGYRLLRAWLYLAGFQIGFLLALWLGGLLSAGPVVRLIGALLSGCVLACVCGLMPKIGRCLASAGSLAFLVLIILLVVRASDTLQAALLTAAAIAGGLLGFFTVQRWLVFVTSFSGACLVVNSLFALIRAYPANETITAYGQATTIQIILLILGLSVLAAASTIAQLRQIKLVELPQDAKLASTKTSSAAAGQLTEMATEAPSPAAESSSPTTPRSPSDSRPAAPPSGSSGSSGSSGNPPSEAK